MRSVLAILTGTPSWVWGVLVLIVYLGMTALHPGRRSPVGLSLAPGIFLTVALGMLLSSTRLGDILPLWLTGCLLGIGIGAAWAMVLRIGIDRSQGIVSMPGTAFWLVTGLILFGMRYSIEVYLALNRNLTQEPLWILMPYIIVGLGAGMSVGWWAALMTRYFRTTGA
ncbi:hypothetical protein [Microvirga sp. BSC39]|uniref:hypothetical protein n=1 Tax=Microvirga sp. BSC39 TaxID=1549810 RepID=UPI0004E90280|nr:hypothetical protein [Microvirga sp. BSC39]KFG70683.1 hypothetical protein JH26_02740 [Microvirga sp. BSC39]